MKHKYNGNSFTVYGDELSMLEIVDEHHKAIVNKTDLFGDHKGTWQGLSKPTLSEEGMRATVEKINEQDIPSINNDITTLKGDKYIFIGDSYGAGWTEGGTLLVNWIDKTISMMGIESLCYKKSNGGVGFSNSGFLTLIKELETTISNKNEVKTIVVGGGFNDNGSTSSIQGGMRTFFDYAKANYPKAKVVICPIGWAVEGMTKGIHKDVKVENLINVILEYQRGAINNGGCYVPGIYSTLHNKKFFSDDYVHPNENGQYNIALYLSNYLKNGSIAFNGEYTIEDCFSDIVLENNINSNGIKGNVTTYSEKSSLQLTHGNIIMKEPLTVTCNGKDYIIGKLRNASINGYKKGTCIKATLVLEINNGASFEMVESIFLISDGYLKLQFLKLNETKTNFLSVSNITKITLNGFAPTVTVDSLLN